MHKLSRVRWIGVGFLACTACGGNAERNASDGGSANEDGTQATSATSTTGGELANGTSTTSRGDTGTADSSSSGSTAAAGSVSSAVSGGSQSLSVSAGGASSGAAATSGMGAGGMPGAGGTETASTEGASTAVSSTGGSDVVRACSTNEDCRLLDDCCSCKAIPVEADAAVCPADCEESACSADGRTAPEAVCIGGRCKLGASCDTRTVVCRVATPECAAGQVPEVVDACYTGRCFSAEQCSGVASCDVCAEGNACVHMETLLLCVPPLEGCALDDCECMQACTPFSCAPSADESDLSCFCLSC